MFVHVTEDEAYKVLVTVTNIRQSLIRNEHFREPYLELLDTSTLRKATLYQTSITSPKKHPTDCDIEDYFRDEWPEIRSYEMHAVKQILYRGIQMLVGLAKTRT